ncbi:MMPL family transporter [Nocardioides sp. CFH 31398]|uniref:MMPL family transporter n=1 Tax=Nocardioides sp. CFH 31398 TaxID=2919579 RepID=UPI001F064C54|nr:MMPL family transporter [Nocardioides sp. CFH 31398]MCH1865651.1 MMPL family transporter [Nocardioides sp. CFH 31398]
MASLLQRLGATAHRRWPAFIALWLVALIGVGAFAGFLSKPLVDSFTIPGIESEEAADLQSELFGGGADAIDQATVNVVVQAPEGSTLADRDVNDDVTALVADLQGIPQLSDADRDPQTSAIVDPVLAAQGVEQQLREGYEQNPATAQLPAEQLDALVEKDVASVSPLSTDGRTGIISFVLDVPTVTEVDPATRDAITDVMDDARDAGLVVEANGQGMQALTDFGVTSEVVGIGVALLVLVLTFGSLVAAGLPILTALVGVGLGLLGVLGATYFTELGTVTPILASMIGLAVGIDYALFILARYRTELEANGGDASRAIGRAVGTAGSAVVFAGLTVVIALAALTVVGIPFLSAMGLAAAATVTIAVLVALTLLPAIVGMFGSKAFGGRVRTYTPKRDADGAVVNNGVRWARLVGKAPLVAIVLVVVGLGALALPGRDLQLAFPSDSTAATDTTQRKASDLIEEAFGPGRESPLLVVVDAREVGDPQAAQAAYGTVVEWAGGQEDVANAQVAQVNDDGTGALVLLTPQSGPTALSTVDLLADLRAEQGDVESETGTTLGVTGLTAIQVDTSEQLDEALPVYLAIVVGLAFLLLMVVFRSILVPLTATLGFLLSVLATLGATVAVFSDGVGGLVDGAPIISFLPVLVIGIVFGLAMDYQVFLVTRIREAHVHGADAREAILDGFRNSARVVAAAAVIMISVFAAFILQEDPIIKSMGFALAAAVAFDAFVVRMTLIPALMFLMKEKAWWLPRWLDRVLPNVDVEGDSLADGPGAVTDAGHKHRAGHADRHPEPAHRA